MTKTGRKKRLNFQIRPSKVDHKAPGYVPPSRRSNLRKKLLEIGHESLTDGELLELVLTLTEARFDTHSLSKRLLADYLPFTEVFSKDLEMKLASAAQREAAQEALAIVSAAASLLSRPSPSRTLVTTSDLANQSQYLCKSPNKSCQIARVIYLDSKNQLKGAESIKKARIPGYLEYSRVVIGRALALHASGVVLISRRDVTNLCASDEDIMIAYSIIAASRSLKITLLDYLLFNERQMLSFRSTGLI